MDATAERVAKNDAAFRAANERIEQRAAEAAIATVPFICECAEESCTAIVRLTLGEYEQIRANGRWFLALPVHGARDSHAGTTATSSSRRRARQRPSSSSSTRATRKSAGER